MQRHRKPSISYDDALSRPTRDKNTALALNRNSTA